MVTNHTFYLIGAYGATIIVVAIELISLFANRRRAIKNAQAQAGLHRANQS
jgi:heme exporter protein CcmD